MNEVFLLLGSDIEPRDKYLAMAEENITVSIGTITKRSEIYESEAYGFNSDKNFLNCVLLLSSKLSAEAILTQIHIIEKKMEEKDQILGTPHAPLISIFFISTTK